METGSKLAVCLLTLVAIAHALRLLFNVEIVAAGAVIPAWASVVGIILPAGIALLLWRERDTSPG